MATSPFDATYNRTCTNQEEYEIFALEILSIESKKTFEELKATIGYPDIVKKLAIKIQKDNLQKIAGSQEIVIKYDKAFEALLTRINHPSENIKQSDSSSIQQANNLNQNKSSKNNIKPRKISDADLFSFTQKTNGLMKSLNENKTIQPLKIGMRSEDQPKLGLKYNKSVVTQQRTIKEPVTPNAKIPTEIPRYLQELAFHGNRAGFQGAFQGLFEKQINANNSSGFIQGDAASKRFLGLANKYSPNVTGALYGANQLILGLIATSPEFADGKYVEVGIASAMMWNNFIHAVGQGDPTLASRILDLVGKPNTYKDLSIAINLAATQLEKCDPSLLQKMNGTIQRFGLTTANQTALEKFTTQHNVLKYGFFTALLVHGYGAGKKFAAILENDDPRNKQQLKNDLINYSIQSFPKDIAIMTAAAKGGTALKVAINESKGLLAEATIKTMEGNLTAAAALAGKSDALLSAAKNNASNYFRTGFIAVDVGSAALAYKHAQDTEEKMQVMLKTPKNDRDEQWKEMYKKLEVNYRVNINNMNSQLLNAGVNVVPGGFMASITLNTIGALTCPSEKQLVESFKKLGIDYYASDNDWLGIHATHLPVNFAALALSKELAFGMGHQYDSKEDYVRIASVESTTQSLNAPSEKTNSANIFMLRRQAVMDAYGAQITAFLAHTTEPLRQMQKEHVFNGKL